MTDSYTWSYLDVDGTELSGAGAATAFPTQAEAEAYLGESWQELADAGVGSVTLRHGAEVVYGPMSLEGA